MSEIERKIMSHFVQDSHGQRGEITTTKGGIGVGKSAYEFNFVIHDGVTPVFSNDPGILRDCMAAHPDRTWTVWKWRWPTIFDLAGVPRPGA